MTRVTLLALGAVLLLLTWAFAAPLPERDAEKRGADQGAGPTKPFAMKEMEKTFWHISFPAGKKAELKVASTNETDVDLFVEEMDGTEVVSDTAESKDCTLEFTPLKQKTYRISIVNLGPGENKCTLTHNGKIEMPDFGKIANIKPFKLAEEGAKSFDAKVKEGQWTAVWATGENATDVDVFVFDPDGKEVASDEHVSKEAFVSFQPTASGTYRIEVRNLGPGENTCTVKHTTVVEAKRAP